jgi:hypothetical protein
MKKSFKTYAKVLPRHHRLMFFVDSSISETALRSMMEANMHIWGGRYNPIVPVHNSTISNEWLELIQHFDPDFIYYSKSLDLQYLESLGLFHPKEYIELREDHRYYFPGVNIHCLLHEHVHNFFLTNHSTLLQYDGDWNMEVKAKPFYQLNFGFCQFYEGEKKWTSRLDAISINKDNATQINQLICTQRPYFKSLLSSLHVNSVYINRIKSWNDSRFEWIIYDKENYLNDLLYYWNRQLYFEPRNILTQVISTLEETEELLKDQWFGSLLKSFSIDSQVSIVSYSVNETIIENLRKEMQEGCKSARIERKELRPFPFKSNDIQYVDSKHFKLANNLILGKTDFLKLPDVTFESGNSIDDGPYAIDILLQRETDDEHTEIKFPYEAELHFISCKEASRVNRDHRITVFTNKQKPGFDISIPSDIELLKSVLMFRNHHGNLLTLPIDHILPSSAGQKLSAFFKIFRNDWNTIKQFLEEKFWLQLFRYESQLDESGILTGRGVFSYQDIEKELNGLYDKYLADVSINMREIPEQAIDQDFILQYVERCKKEAFAYYIHDEINFLIDNGGLFVGMKVKCHQCGSNKWYSLTELRDKLPCKGCNSEIIPNLESKVYFKLSDTIINNLLSDQTKNHKKYDGNYVVMKTLIYLKNDSSETGSSFHWAPCMDFQGKNAKSPITSDVDIIAIQNGKLVIGEAKYNATEFSSKVKDSLIWMANELLPDKLIVSCAEGSLDEVVEYINRGLTNKRCQVISYKIFPAWYHFPGIFGMGIPKEDVSGLNSKTAHT